MRRSAVSGMIAGVMAITVFVPDLASARSPAEVCTVGKFPNLERVVSQRRMDLLGGGEIQQGPFTFCLFLYTSPDPVVFHPGKIEDIPDAYWAAFWRYDGNGTRVRVTYHPVPAASDSRQLTYQLHQGDSGGQFSNGVRLTRDNQGAEPGRVGIRLDAGDGPYGATLSFDVKYDRLKDISVSPDVPGGRKPIPLFPPRMVPQKSR